MPLRTGFQLTLSTLSSKRNSYPGGTSTASQHWHSYIVTLPSDNADPNSNPRTAMLEHAYEGSSQQHEIRWTSTISMQIEGEAVELHPAQANVQEVPRCSSCGRYHSAGDGPRHLLGRTQGDEDDAS
mmetsp:Transcript_15633/g.33111  ORF Transcript_15633/g.33111 Transcript_15633/m.33111 type:complete len:127 (+) Transcript_15633:74-454(+)